MKTAPTQPLLLTCLSKHRLIGYYKRVGQPALFFYGKTSMRIISVLLVATLLAGCSNFEPAPPAVEEEPVSILTGKPGGIKLGDLGGLTGGTGDSMPVNAILWRASLDIISLIPIADVDTFGGTIVSDWYSLAGKPDERIKITIFVSGRELRSDAVRITVHIQSRDGSDGIWGASVRDDEFAKRLEDLVLNRAREIRAQTITEVVE